MLSLCRGAHIEGSLYTQQLVQGISHAMQLDSTGGAQPKNCPSLFEVVPQALEVPSQQSGAPEMGERGCSWLLPGTEVFVTATFSCIKNHIGEQPEPPKARAGNAQHRGVFESSFHAERSASGSSWRCSRLRSLRQTLVQGSKPWSNPPTACPQ